MAELVTVNKAPLTPLRRIIRDRMTESFKIPQFSAEIEIDMQKMMDFRAKLPEKPSVTACLIYCCAKALKDKPEMNAYFLEDGIGLVQEVNIGVAVAIPGGLIVPVIRDADKKGLIEINNDLNGMIEKVKNNKLSPDDMQGGTFTFSNLGMYGISKFTALLNPTQVAIMAVGGLRESIRLREGAVESYKYITVNVTSDHRAIDGAVAAGFLSIFKKHCESVT